MSLIAWYPLNGHLNNQGIGDITPISTTNTSIFASGKIGQALTLTSTNFVIPLDINTSEGFSLSLWVKPNSPAAWSDIITFTPQTERIEKTSSDSQYTWYSSTAGILTSGTSLFTMADNIWNHVTITTDGQITNVYLNGEFIKSGTVSANYTITSAIIGNRGGSQFYSGYLNDLRIYDHCLSPKEIKEISKGLVLHYPMNEIDGVFSGRNLFIRSSNAIKLVDASISTSAVSSRTLEDGILTLDCSVSSGECYYRFMAPSASNMWNTIAGATYTISGKIKASTTSGTLNRIYIRKQDNVNSSWGNNFYLDVVTTNVDEWVDFSGTYTVREEATGHYVSVQAVYTTSWVGTIQLKDLKFELGSIATKWTPAPEEFINLTNFNSSSIQDVSGYKNNGIATNPIWSEEAKIGEGSYEFTGTEFIIAPRTAMVTDAITVSVWGYMDDWSLYNNGMRLFSCTQGGGWNIEPMDSYVQFAIGTGTTSNTYQSVKSSVLFADLETGWHLFTGTYDGLSSKIYIDGVLKGTNSAYSTATPIYYYSANTIFIGAEAGTSATEPAGNYFTGCLNDFRIYATALADSDVLELYSTRFSIADNGTLYCSQYIEPDEVFAGRNLLLNSDTEFNNNDYRTAKYFPVNPLEEGETYTCTICVTPAKNVIQYNLYIPDVNLTLATVFEPNGTEKQILSKTFTMSYTGSYTPENSLDNAVLRIYRMPNNSTVTTNSVVHWAKVEKGSMATPWSPALEDYGIKIEDNTTYTSSFASNGIFTGGLVETDNDMAQISDYQIMLDNLIEN